MSHITFVVRDDSSHSDIVLQTSDATWQAYNTYGGNSLYRCTNPCPPGDPTTYKGAYAVSYNRPLNTAADDSGRSALFTGGEWPMIRFLEANGYDVSYISQVDTQASPALLRNHELFISSGHDEYWSAEQRASMEQARDAGANLAFFTGNTGFWKTRYAPSTAGPSTPNRTLISYKDTHFTEQEDPVTWTGTWRDGRFASAADNIRPENALTGGSFLVNSGTSEIKVPAAFGKLRMWRNTDAAGLASGEPDARVLRRSATSGTSTPTTASARGQHPALGDHATNLEVFTDYGSTTQVGRDGHAPHDDVQGPERRTRVQHQHRAVVVGSGRLQTENGNAPDRNMQQATVNVLADLDARPGTLAPNLMPASKTTDTSPPTATLNTPAGLGRRQRDVTLSGTAADTGGGRVAGIEVSTDGGATWHPANGTTSWTYSWFAHGNPTATIKVRATDDSANLGNADCRHVGHRHCPCSLWGGQVAPSTRTPTPAMPLRPRSA